MVTKEMSLGELCPDCSHSFDAHELVTTEWSLEQMRDNPEVRDKMGIMRCPEPGCDCTKTWGFDWPGTEQTNSEEFLERDQLEAREQVRASREEASQRRGVEREEKQLLKRLEQEGEDGEGLQ